MLRVKTNYVTSLTNTLASQFWLRKPLDLPISLNMHVLLLFLIGVTAYATSRISNRFPRFQAANFGEMMDGRQLNGSVIKEIEVESESSCRLECVNEERCKSYNFGGKKNKSERWKCQISDSDRFERPARANFIENKEFSYRGIKVFALHFKRFWRPPRYTNKFQKMTVNVKRKSFNKIAELHLRRLYSVFFSMLARTPSYCFCRKVL